MHPIERYRRARGLTQVELAEAIGVHQNTVQRWENGAMPRPGQLVRIAATLGVDPTTLVDELDTAARSS